MSLLEVVAILFFVSPIATLMLAISTEPPRADPEECRAQDAERALKRPSVPGSESERTLARKDRSHGTA